MANKSQLKAYAKRMRSNPTPSEKRARIALKKARIPFKEQVPFKFYILDFIISNRLLVLEIDGGYHKTRSYKDKKRDEFCRKIGLKVLRMHNHEVKNVVKRVKRFAVVKNYRAKLKTIMNKIKNYGK